MSHLVITNNTTNVMIMMTRITTIVVPAATGRTDEPAFKIE